MGWSYFGARMPSVPRPTPRSTLCIGVRGERERRGRGMAAPTSEAGVGEKPTHQDLGIPDTPAENSGTGSPWALGVVATRASRLLEK